jgi:hypothetical protein
MSALAILRQVRRKPRAGDNSLTRNHRVAAARSFDGCQNMKEGVPLSVDFDACGIALPFRYIPEGKSIVNVRKQRMNFVFTMTTWRVLRSDPNL